MNYTVSVVIPTRNRPKEVNTCLENLKNQTYLPQEVIIVDSSEESIQPKVQTLVEEFPDYFPVKYIHTHPGIPHQHKVGIKNACSEILLLLDDDVFIEKEFIEAIVDVFKKYSHLKIGGVMGNEVNTLRIPRLSLRYWIRQLFFLYNSGNGKFRLSGLQTYPKPEGIRKTEFLAGGRTAYLKKVLEEISPDEENFTSCSEDLAISYIVTRIF